MKHPTHHWNLTNEQARRDKLCATGRRSSGLLESMLQSFAFKKREATQMRRKHGYWIEHGDDIIGVLHDGRDVEMFWCSYALTAFKESTSSLAKRLHDPSWWRTDEVTSLTIRSRFDGRVAEHTYPSSELSDGRINWRSI